MAGIGMDAHMAEELYYKYGHKESPFEECKALYRFLYILKHNPGFDNAQWQTRQMRSHGLERVLDLPGLLLAARE